MITLLKSAILQQPLPLPEDFDLEKAMPLVRSHQVASLIYDGAACCGDRRCAAGKLFPGKHGGGCRRFCLGADHGQRQSAA